MKVVYPYDTTPFVKISIEEVVMTLAEAIVLVFLVMYLFLQNFRATLIPTIAVPVVLLGTFGVMAAFGFSINTLTMFGMVLAIGLLVDDAIVVVENVERVMARRRACPPRRRPASPWTRLPAPWSALPWCSRLFLCPWLFSAAPPGVIYRQFSITIVSAMVLSVLVALILTPALCATLLKPVEKGHLSRRRHVRAAFSAGLTGSSERSRPVSDQWSVVCSTRDRRYLVMYLLIVAAMAYPLPALPTSFLPDEDQGFF